MVDSPPVKTSAVTATTEADLAAGAVKGHLATLGAILAFGLMSPMCKVAMQGGLLDGPALATLRVSGAAVLFWLLSCFVKTEKVAPRDWWRLLGMSLCGMAINQYCYVTGMQYTAPTNGCVAATSTPVFTFILSAVFLKYHVTRRKVFGLVLAACGALVLVLGSHSTGGLGGHPLGDALCLFAQFAAACYFVFFCDVLGRYSPFTLMKWLFTLSAAVTLPFCLPHMAALPWGELTPAHIGGACYVVLFGTFISYLLLIIGQQHLEPPTVATYNYVQPAIAAAAGCLLGVDMLTWQKSVALLLIVAGVWFVSRSGRR